MVEQAEQFVAGAALDDTALAFDVENGSVFDHTPFIDAVGLAEPPRRPQLPPAPQPAPVGSADRTWQAAAGGRLLTPAEQAARERYFDAKAAVAIARARSAGRRPNAA